MKSDIPSLAPESISFDILFGIPELQEIRAFGSGSSISWESAQERDDLKDFCKNAGFQILENRENQKKWPAGRRQESALGYSDFQRLLVFPYSVPKTTLTLLWHKGTANFPWTPLFITPED